MNERKLKKWKEKEIGDGWSEAGNDLNGRQERRRKNWRKETGEGERKYE